MGPARMHVYGRGYGLRHFKAATDATAFRLRRLESAVRAAQMAKSFRGFIVAWCDRHGRS